MLYYHPAVAFYAGIDPFDHSKAQQLFGLDTMRADAAQRRANGELVRNHDAAAVRPMPANVRRLPQLGNASVADDAPTRAGAAHTLPQVAPVRRADMRPGELPSARFVRPQRRMPTSVDGERRSAGGEVDAADNAKRATTDADSQRSRRDESPRPGLSIISAGDTDRAVRSAGDRPPSAQRLPQAPRFVRGNVDNASVDRAPEARQVPVINQDRMVRHNVPTNEDALPQRQLPQRFERPEPAREMQRQAPQIRAPRPMDAAPPQQFEQRRQTPRAPEAMPPPRMVVPQQVRSERAAPAQSEDGKGKPARRSNDRRRGDDQQN